MKALVKITLLHVVALVVLVAGCGQQAEQPMDAPSEDMSQEMPMEPVSDAVTAAPDVYSVLHEDERVRIVEMKLPAGVTDGEHQHPAEAVYVLSGSTLKIHTPEGEAMEMAVPDGGQLLHDAWTHTVENAGDTEFHAIIVELQEGGADSAGVVEAGMAAHEVAPDVYTVLAEDERFRMLEMKLPAGATDGPHVHPAEAAYFISGGSARIDVMGGESMEATLPDGATLSNPMWGHTVTNIGDSDIHAIVVELKQPTM